MSLLIFIYALLIGSFLNVCIYRIPAGESIVFPGSRCGSCQTKLRPWDLIPVLSWLSTKGTCRYCGEKVSIQYPAVELVTAILTVAVYQVIGFDISFLWACFLLWTGIVISLIDLKHQLIPNRLSLITALGGVVFYIVLMVQTQTLTLSPIFGAIVGGGFLLILALLSSMGGGDIKYMTGAGLFLGPSMTILALYVAFILGGLVSMVLLLTKKFKKGTHIPFGPFLVIGVVTAFVLGPQILATYLNWVQF